MTPYKNSPAAAAKNYTARYLVLLRQNDATRALLFGGDERYLAEVIDDDDGLVLDNLVRAGRACRPPAAVVRHANASAPAQMRCFALDVQSGSEESGSEEDECDEREEVTSLTPGTGCNA